MKIDREDQKRVSQYKWSSQGRYLRINRSWDGKQHNIYLHHFLIGMPLNRTLEVDHINRNPLDNRKSNLRFVTSIEQQENRDVGTGTYWDKDRGNWVAQATINKKVIYLGSYKSKKEADDAKFIWKGEKGNVRKS